MKFIAIPDLTTFAASVLVVMALATPYFLVRHRDAARVDGRDPSRRADRRALTFSSA